MLGKILKYFNIVHCPRFLLYVPKKVKLPMLCYKNSKMLKCIDTTILSIFRVHAITKQIFFHWLCIENTMTIKIYTNAYYTPLVLFERLYSLNIPTTIVLIIITTRIVHHIRSYKKYSSIENLIRNVYLKIVYNRIHITNT